jgi:S-DNA-T family DNA segregation ATPase FtsK/SpoIIIE
MKENVTYFDGTKACAEQLARMGTVLGLRLEALAQAGASTLDEYQKANLSRNATNPLKAKDMEKRCFIIIDEVSELSAKGGGIDKETLVQAKAALNRIARQGRAAGVHLIVATQKPDSSNFDQTVKANLPGVLCFPMATQAASVSAIGTKRAFELNPDIKGRAFWKFGPKTEEVQTYYFT